MQCVPVDGDLAAADPEKSAEIDNRGAHLAGAVDQNVHDPAHILVGRAADLSAQYALNLMLIEEGQSGGGGAYSRRRLSLVRIALGKRGGQGDGNGQQTAGRHRQATISAHAASAECASLPCVFNSTKRRNSVWFH